MVVESTKDFLCMEFIDVSELRDWCCQFKSKILPEVIFFLLLLVLNNTQLIHCSFLKIVSWALHVER